MAQYNPIINEILGTLYTQVPTPKDGEGYLTPEAEQKIYELLDGMPREKFYDFIDCIPELPDGMWHDAQTPKELNREIAFWTVLAELGRKTGRYLRIVRS